MKNGRRWIPGCAPRFSAWPLTSAKSEPSCPKCGEPLALKSVPGATRFPRLLECPEHGWQQEREKPIRMRFHKDAANW